MTIAGQENLLPGITAFLASIEPAARLEFGTNVSVDSRCSNQGFEVTVGHRESGHLSKPSKVRD